MEIAPVRLRRALVGVAAVGALAAGVVWLGAGEGDGGDGEPLLVAARVSSGDVAFDLVNGRGSPLDIDPAAGEAEGRCVADELLADLGAEQLSSIGLDGDGELGPQFESWLARSIPPSDDVARFWDALFGCVDGAGFVARQTGLVGTATGPCVVQKVLADDDVRLLFVYGVRPGATYEPSGAAQEWLRRYEQFVADCAPAAGS